MIYLFSCSVKGGDAGEFLDFLQAPISVVQYFPINSSGGTMVLIGGEPV
jgi:hypothetical protein